MPVIFPNERLHDKTFLDLVKGQFGPDEDYVWHGSPDATFEFTPFVTGEIEKILGFRRLFFYSLFTMCITSYFSYKAESIFLLAMSVIIGFVFMFGPDIHKQRRKENTAYVLSDKRAYFKLWWLGKVSYFYLDYDDLASFYPEEFKDLSGTIHFLPKTYFDFYTYNFLNSERRHYPTFERIPDVKHLCTHMNDILIRMNN